MGGRTGERLKGDNVQHIIDAENKKNTNKQRTLGIRNMPERDN